MKLAAPGVLLLLLVLPALRADDKPKDKSDAKPDEKAKAKPATPSEQYRALLREYTEAARSFSELFQAAKTREEKQKLIRETYPPDKYVPRFLQLAQKNPKDPVAIDALVWILSNSRTITGKDSPRGKALAILARDHVASDKVGNVCDSLIYARDADSEAFLRKVLDKNPSREMQARACLDLGMNLNNRQKQKEAEEILDRAVTKYGDVKHPTWGTVGKKADALLYGIRFLSVGKTVPEVTGEDQDGKQFKLSDYRGKVVLLDFWGNW